MGEGVGSEMHRSSRDRTYSDEIVPGNNAALGNVLEFLLRIVVNGKFPGLRNG